MEPKFLGASRVLDRGIGQEADVIRLDEVELDDLQERALKFAFHYLVQAANK